MVSNETSAAEADGHAPPLFLRVQYEVPSSDACNLSEQMIDEQDQTDTITKQLFDASNCPAATIGLPSSVEPTKPEPGDFTYSGVHDQGPLPLPKEGGKFAQIIGFVNAAKNASDKYLTEVIENEKALKGPVAFETKQLQNRKRK